MKEIFIATSGIPGTNSFSADIFELESEKAESVLYLTALARKAGRMYAMTDEGVKEYEGNCENFNWGDFLNCNGDKKFKEICKNVGIAVTYVNTISSSERWVDSDEQLMEDIKVRVTGIEWDTDGEEVPELPTETTITLPYPNADIADALSDQYGFCVNDYDTTEVL